MIVPCIDLMAGRAVQLIGGKEKALDGGDPRELAERFAPLGEIAVVDLDAAMGRGDNRPLVRDLVRRARCRVGGGIRSADDARRWFDAGAEKVVLGTAARPEVLAALPKPRVVVALDARDGEVVVDGWQRGSGATIEQRLAELQDLAGGFLVTLVEREGRMVGCDLERAAALRARCPGAAMTFAGGIRTADEIAALDRLGIDAQVGMAIYTGVLDLAEAFAAPLTSDRADGLWPTIVVDERGAALGLCWSNLDSLRAAIDERRGVYWSRKRGLWRKGETSGAVQELLAVDVDCDRDCLRFTVRQRGGFCHTGARSCFGRSRGLDALEQTLRARTAAPPAGSYTGRLFGDAELLAAKLREEAQELADARDPAQVAAEAADVVYFTAVALARAGVAFADVERELDRRALRSTRRAGDAKEERG